jgi:hypothetical protein
LLLLLLEGEGDGEGAAEAEEEELEKEDGFVKGVCEDGRGEGVNGAYTVERRRRHRVARGERG